MKTFIKPLSVALISSGLLATTSTMAGEKYKAPSQTNKSDVTAEEYWKDFKHDSKETWQDGKEAFRDGWMEGRLESAIVMSEYLNPLDIDIEVSGDQATLEGEVESAMIKEHAKLVALGVEGIDRVDNQLRINPSKKTKNEAKAENHKRDFSRVVKDAVITTAVKTELLTNSDVAGLDIDVDTHKGIVTLSGGVESTVQKSLAEYIAKSHDDVQEVENELRIDS